MKKLRKQSNISNEKTITLQQMIDVWYETWIGRTGREGHQRDFHHYFYTIGSVFDRK